MVVLAGLVGLAPGRAHAGPAPVVGGTPARSADWPDVVAVLGRDGLCTGTLIAPDVVLTAGHCIDIQPIAVVTHADRLEPGAPAEAIDVKWSRAYPAWQDTFDVGVLVLEHVARGAPRAIASACLANQQLATKAPVTVVGYGLVTEDASDDNTRLNAARLAVTDPFCEHSPGCQQSAGARAEFVAGGHGADSCFGDSGGPAYLATADGFALAGVVSRGLDVPGLPCGQGGIYVRADKVVAWIQSVTDRKLVRAACARPGDDPDQDGDEQGGSGSGDVGESAGCSAASNSAGAAPLVGLVLLAIGRGVVPSRRASRRR